ncbi:single-stranded DNA-binding protein [Priestia filamentosa]|uniref:single-stranded DNA-binding protein n=1 Tax=Priestia filamentosa TaxID=1402861 RepID=UPI00397C3AE3
MKERVYKKDINRVEVSGEVQNLPEFVRYIQTTEGIRPLISFDLICYRNRKSEEDEWKTDELKMVLFDNEAFLQEVKEGDRYSFVCELQSRNYNRVNEEMDELFALAVENYHAITGEYPCESQPTFKKKEVIDWRKLIQFTLIPDAPEDSMYDRDMVKGKSQETPFIYLVNVDGEVTKESQHVTYELVAIEEPVKLEEELHPLNGDINRVKMAGRVTRDPFFNFLGQENPVAFVNFNVGTKSAFFSEHMFFNNAIAWAKNAEKVFENVKEGDYVFFKGRLQSRPYIKKFRKRWTTPGGNKKKKDIEVPLKTREVSISYIEKLVKKEKEKE